MGLPTQFLSLLLIHADTGGEYPLEQSLEPCTSLLSDAKE
jgi:hypothetical protein